jgi:hypothetical protein
MSIHAGGFGFGGCFGGGSGSVGTVDLTTGVSGVLPVANGGTGTATGSITGTGALTFAAAGTNQPVTLTPSGTGAFIVTGLVNVQNAAPVGTFVGLGAGASNTGIENTGFGRGALWSNTTGTNNNAIGAAALTFNLTGGNNNAMGMNTLRTNTSGGENVAVGTYALYSANASGNTAVGTSTLYANTSGHNNVAIGYGAGQNAGTALQTNSHSVYIGVDANANADALTNAIVIGDTAQGTASNQITLGNTSVTATVMPGKVTSYNNIVAVANGVPSEYAQLNLTAQTASIGTTTLYAVPAAGAGMYRISYYLFTSAAGNSVTTLATFGWNDANAQTLATGTIAIQTLGDYEAGTMVLYSAASQNITYATTVSGAVGTGTYALYARVEAI